VLEAPYWLLVAVLLAPNAGISILYRRARRRRRRARRGLCQARGYDLRATPDVCPECGTPRDVTPAREARRPTLEKSATPT
jgi:hypothetical protein